MPNPNFGGSKTQSEIVRDNAHCFRKLNRQRCAPGVEQFMKLCEDAAAADHGMDDRVDQAFEKLLPTQFDQIPQQHAAWFEVRRRHLATASGMWDLLLLPCLPRLRQKKSPLSLDVHVPDHRYGMFHDVYIPATNVLNAL